jgi:hypothetical protein
MIMQKDLPGKYTLRIDGPMCIEYVKQWPNITPLEQVQNEYIEIMRYWDRLSVEYYKAMNIWRCSPSSAVPMPLFQHSLFSYPSEGCDADIIMPDGKTLNYLDADMDPDGNAHWEIWETLPF